MTERTSDKSVPSCYINGTPVRCFKCHTALSGEWAMVNLAPNAASGGTMMPFHKDCAPQNWFAVSSTDAPTSQFTAKEEPLKPTLYIQRLEQEAQRSAIRLTQADVDAEDAARYRWLRDVEQNRGEGPVALIFQTSKTGMRVPVGTEIDALIDSVISDGTNAKEKS